MGVYHIDACHAGVMCLDVYIITLGDAGSIKRDCLLTLAIPDLKRDCPLTLATPDLKRDCLLTLAAPDLKSDRLFTAMQGSYYSR